MTRAAVLLLVLAISSAAQAPIEPLFPGSPALDAHNCYPEEGRWADRIERALRAGSPIGIEQDLTWRAGQGGGRIAISHSAKTTGAEPGLREYFFERVRPIVEKALAENNTATWPLIILHLDFKSEEPELLKAVWDLLGEYEPWLTTARKTAGAREISPLRRKPLLTLTEGSGIQAKAFHDDLPAGAILRILGAAPAVSPPSGMDRASQARWMAAVPAERILPVSATNYRRWWNLPWSVVEEGGQQRAGDWTAEDLKRLRALVDRAHALGYFIRFYTLNGTAESGRHGWSAGYNFGSRDAALPRWRAAIDAGVDLIATDQYEDLGNVLRQTRRR